MPSNNSNNDQEKAYHHENTIHLGLILAILSTVFIGSSFIIKKKALIKINNQGNLRAGAGGFSYLKEWMWWAGFLSSLYSPFHIMGIIVAYAGKKDVENFILKGGILTYFLETFKTLCSQIKYVGIGEVANFAAYAFAPASLVTPMGALSVLVSAVLAAKFLKERLNLLGKLGCILCVLGSTVIVIHSPKEESVESLESLVEKLKDSAFITYTVIVILISLSIYYYFGPRYGHIYVSVYITLCSGVGSLTVMACKGLGIAIKESLTGGVNEFGNSVTWLFLVAIVVCIMIQMNYLNKALDMFNTGIVTPVYYVFFTTLVIVASAILYREWQSIDFNDVLGNLCGFVTVVIAILMLNGFREFNVTFADIQASLKAKQKDEPVRSSFRKSYYIDEESELQSSKQASYGVNGGHNM